MGLDINKYCKPSKKRSLLQVLKIKWYAYNKQADRKDREREVKSNNVESQNTIAVLFACGVAICIFFVFLGHLKTYLDNNFFYSVAMPKITGYFIKRDDGFTANGIYTISSKEKAKGEKSAGLLFGEINCDYYGKYCKEELISILNISGVYMFPHIEKYNITYRDKNRVIYSDGYNTSVVVDLNQETITKTTYKTFLQEKPKTQIDEFITDTAEILKEEKRVISKHLKKNFW